MEVNFLIQISKRKMVGIITLELINNYSSDYFIHLMKKVI